MLNNVIASLSGAGAPVSTTAYESIATVTVGSGGQSSITFSSIPQTYAHLQIRGIAHASTASSITITFNGTTSTYKNHYLEGSGTAVSAGAETNSGIALYASNPSATSVFSGLVWDILDYSNTNKNKVLRALNGWDANGSGFIDFDSGLWVNTNAITQIDIAATGTSFTQYTSFALYGIKGS